MEHRYKYVLLMMCWLGFFYNVLNRNIVSSVLPLIMGEFALSYTESGFIISMLILTHTLLQLPSGYLADRFDKRKLTTSCTILYSFATIIAGLFSSTYPQLVLFHGLMGVAGSLYFISSQTLIVEYFSPEKRGKALGIWFTAFPISILVAALVFSPLAETSGWRIPYIVSGLLGFVVAGLLWITIKEPEKVTHGFSGSYLHVIRNPLINKLAIISFLIVQIAGFISFLPTFLVKEYELDLTMAGLLWSITPLASIFGSIIGGSVCDAFDKRKMIILSSFLSSSILISLFVFSRFLSVVMFAFVIVIIAERIAELATTTHLANLAKTEERAKTLAYLNMAGIGAMAVSTSAIGLMADNFGYASIFVFLSFTMLLSSVVALKIPKNKQCVESTH